MQYLSLYLQNLFTSRRQISPSYNLYWHSRPCNNYWLALVIEHSTHLDTLCTYYIYTASE